MVRRGKKNTRRSRKGSKKSRYSRRMRGGWQRMSPAGVNDNTMMGPSQLSYAQGREFNGIHAEQHGGGHLQGAPVGTTGMLDSSLRADARVSPTDDSIGAIQGMSDQSGGYRRKGRSRRSKRSKRSKRGSKRSRRSMRGGAMPLMTPSDYHAPGHLLSPSMESKALMAMNPEWKLAENPGSFAPSQSS